MASVMSYEQDIQMRKFERTLFQEDSLVCPKAPTIKPMSFYGKEDHSISSKDMEALSSLMVSERDSDSHHLHKKEKKKLPMLAFLKNKRQSS